MDFATVLRDRAAAVQSYLDGRLSLKPPAVKLTEAMRYAVLGGGKRLRPFFLIESAALFGVPQREAIPAAAALECVHCYSLVHDDLPSMDDDDLRRGRPTTHVAFGEALAILAGDALLTFAFEILADDSSHPDPAVRTALILALAKAAGAEGMAGGQALDMGQVPAELDLKAHIASLQQMKTGALFSFALEGGAMLGRATPSERTALKTYASKIGLAFQIADDVLDRLASPSVTGKQTGKDRGKGKLTLVDSGGIDGAKREAARLLAEALAALDLFGRRADLLRLAARFVVDRTS